MRLHNRQIKATFWNDPDLLQWHRDKRWFYEGLSQLADDSGCLEDSPFAFKLHLFPSPLDTDITVDVINGWVEELVAEKKLVRYEAKGKKCLFLVNFHKHQALRSPASPEVPLPVWVTFTPSERSRRSGTYTVGNPFEILTDSLRSGYSDQPEPEEEPEPEPEPEEEEEEEPEMRTEIESSSSATSGSPEMNIYDYYTHCGFGTLSGNNAETLDSLVEDYSEPWVRLALKEGDEYGKRSFAYIRRILNDWRTSGGPKQRAPDETKGKQKNVPKGWNGLNEFMNETEGDYP